MARQLRQVPTMSKPRPEETLQFGAEVDPSPSSIRKNTAKLEDVYKFLEERPLGKGAFGVVYKVIEKKTGQVYACKRISIHKLPTDDDKPLLRQEIHILKHLSGQPHIVEYKECFEENDYIYLILELCQGGELIKLIMENSTYSEKDAATIMRAMLEGVHRMHDFGVVHRDLKPENMLLSKQGDYQSLKLIDFGLSTMVFNSKPLPIVGSPFYIAPEVLQRMGYPKEVDVWSCGFTLYVLLCGCPPWHSTSVRDMAEEILHGEVDLVTSPWDTISEPAKNCLRRMLARDPAERASVEEILRDAWMQVSTNRRRLVARAR